MLIKLRSLLWRTTDAPIPGPCQGTVGASTYTQVGTYQSVLSSSIALLAVAAPFSNPVIPNPSRPPAANTGFVQGTNPCLTPMPVGQQSAVQPQRPQAQPVGFVSSTPLPLTAAQAPFNQTDWPNPQRPQYQVSGFVSGFQVQLQPDVVTPCGGKIDAVLVTQVGRYQSVAGSPAALLATPAQAPFQQTDWPNPRFPARVDLSFVQSGQPRLSNPFNQTDWPNPRRPGWSDLGFVQSGQPRLSNPFNQTDWPNPRASARVDGFVQSGLALLSTPAATPFNQTDWPNPRFPARWDLQKVEDHFTVFNIPAPAKAWPNPRLPDRVDFGFVQSGQPRLIDPPSTRTAWPNPQTPARVDGFVRSGSALYAVTGLPFQAMPWPNPRFPDRWDLGKFEDHCPIFEVTGPAQSWPNPRFPERRDSSFVQSGLAALTTPPGQPFQAMPWPNPRFPERWDLGKFEDHCPIFEVTGPAQSWPNPRWPIRPDSSFMQSGLALLVPVVQAPFTQTDWPNPRLPIRPDASFVQSGLAVTIAPNNPSPSNKDWPNPRWPIRVDVSFIQSGLALLTTPPPVELTGSEIIIRSRRRRGR